MSRSFRRDGLIGPRALLLFQAMACLGLGASVLVSPPAATVGLVMWLGLYWLARSYATVAHVMFESPHRWEGRGLIAVLQLVAALLVFQAPLLGLYDIGVAIVLFLGFQALVAGGLELVVAARSNAHSMAFLGLVNTALGLTLVAPLLAGVGISMTVVGAVAVVGAVLAIYCLLWLPTPRRRADRWRLDRS